MSLPVNLKNDILNPNMNGHRKFNIVDENGDVVLQNVRIQDVSSYLQVGSTIDADVVNEQNAAINALEDVPDDISAINSSLNDLYNNGVKNILKCDLNLIKNYNTEGTWNGLTYVNNGITFKINTNGGGIIDSIEVSGTAAARNTDLVLSSGDLSVYAGDILSGCPSGGGNSSFSLHAELGVSPWTMYAYDYGNGGTISNTIGANSKIFIRVHPSVSISGTILFKPMITDASCPNSDYAHWQPYAESNSSLTKRAILSHNVPRLAPKDITSYVTDGTLWQRLKGTNGFDLFEDIYCGDYIHMSRAISAYEQTQTYQLTGSDYVTIAEIDGKMGDGDINPVNYHHLVMIPGKGFGGTQHFGRSRMNSTNTTVGGYTSSEMFTTTIGAVVSSGSTASQATINQQLYAEFGSHLKTIRQMLSNSINATGYNRFGTNSGCANGFEWTSVQAFLMSEIEVYGSVVWGSSGYDVGTGNHQFALFRHSREAMNDRTTYYWLKDIVTATLFADFYADGHASCHNANEASHGVRPCFVIA